MSLEDKPIIFSKNYINADDTITPSSGDAVKAYAYDRDKDSQWESVGSSDGVVETYAAKFYEGPVATARAFDSIFILNHNLKEFSVQTSPDGITWTTIPTITWPTANAAADTFVDLRAAEGGPGAQTAYQVRLRAVSTIVADQEKAVGEFVVCLRTYTFENAMESYRRKDRQEVRDVKLGSGRLDRTAILHDVNNFQNYEAQVGLRYRTQAEITALKAVKAAISPFLWWPEPVTAIRDLFFVRWENPFEDAYSDFVKTAGKSIDIQLREV